MKDCLSLCLRAALAAAAFVCFGFASAQARQSKARASETALSERQKEMRQLGKKTTDSMYLGMTMEQVNEDFEHLKMANNEIVRMLRSRDALNLKQVAETAGEVRDRASHVRKSLALPEPEKGEKGRKELEGPDAEQMRQWLQAVSDLITSFVTNPVFKSEKEIDPKLAAQARRDLEELIEVSGLVKKSAEKIEKARVK